MTDTERADAPIDAVLLAAGAGSRMALAPRRGASKLTLPFGSSTVVGTSLRALLNADAFRHVVVVVGHAADAVERAARLRAEADGSVSFARNADYAAGMETSIGVGVRALPDAEGRVAVALGDLPLVRPATVRALVEVARAAPPNAVVRPTYGGAPGHPVVFGSEHRRRLAAAAEAAPRLAREARLVDVEDAGVTFDVDTPEAYAAACARLGGGASSFNP